MSGYTHALPYAFPYVFTGTEAECNKLIRILLRNDRKSRPNNGTPFGTSYAYTVDVTRDGKENKLWLSLASFDRIVYYTKQTDEDVKTYKMLIDAINRIQNSDKVETGV